MALCVWAAAVDKIMVNTGVEVNPPHLCVNITHKYTHTHTVNTPADTY